MYYPMVLLVMVTARCSTLKRSTHCIAGQVRLRVGMLMTMHEQRRRLCKVMLVLQREALVSPRVHHLGLEGHGLTNSAGSEV